VFDAKCTVIAVGDNHLVEFRHVGDTLGFAQTCDTSNLFALSEIYDLKSVISEGRDEQSPTFEVYADVIDAAIHFRKRNRLH
jgi:hypothetical protein